MTNLGLEYLDSLWRGTIGETIQVFNQDIVNYENEN